MKSNDMGSSSVPSSCRDIRREDVHRAGTDEKFRDALLEVVKRENPYPRSYCVFDGNRDRRRLLAMVALFAIRQEQFKVIREKPEEEQLRIFAELLTPEGEEKIAAYMKEEHELHEQLMKEAEHAPEKREECRKMHRQYNNHICQVFCDHIGD